MTIELILAEDIPNIAKTGDTVVLKDNQTFEIQKMNPEKEARREEIAQYPGQKRISEKEDEDKVSKEFADYTDFADCVSKNKDKSDPDAYCGSIKHKVEDTKKDYDPRIQKYLPNDSAKAWAILEKFYKTNKYFNANAVLKEFINKIATCPEVTDKFDKIMEGWMRDGEANISGIEKVIDACKEEGGNIVVKSKDNPTQAERDEAHRIAREKALEHASKVTKEVIEEVVKSKDNPTQEEKDQAHKIAREKALAHETEVAHETARKLAVSHAKDVTKEILNEVTK